MRSILDSWRRSLPRQPWLRESSIILSCVLIGAIVLPVCVYLAGVPVLGPYANGGVGRFIADVVRALAAGSVPFWLFVAGPYVALSLWRLLRWSWRGGQHTGASRH